MSGDDTQQEKPTEAPAAGIPEVEAELVDEESAETTEPFDNPAQDDSAKTPRRSFISPGVIFFAGLVVIALAAGLYWFFGADKEPAAILSESAGEKEIEAALADKLGEQEKDEKIANTDIISVKPPPAASAPDGSTLADAAAELSTPVGAIENTELIEEAKEAAADQDATPADIEDDAPEISLELEETAPPGGALNDDVEKLGAGDADDNKPLTDASEPDVSLEAADRSSPGGAVEQRDTEGNAALIDPGAAAALAAELDTLQFDLAAANDALQEARSKLASAEDEIRLLRAENDRLEKARREAPLADAAIALNAIEKAADAGAPYESELADLKRSGPDANAVAVLNGYALGGAPTLDELRAGFAAAARDGLAAANRENANNIAERYGARVAALFNIRPAAPQPGNNPAAIISRAEHAAEKGDLPRAIAEIADLPPDARRAMKSWTDRARRRAEIDAALQLLNAEIAEKAAQPESL